MGLFTKRIAYKPFEYPEYDVEAWLPQSLRLLQAQVLEYIK